MSTFYTPHSLCRFGIACCDITPPVGIYHRMWGAAKQDESTGVHRPLQASAMIFEDEHGNDEQVVVALDHVLLWSREMDRLRREVCTATWLAEDRLLVTFSHTHAAGLMDLDRKNLPGGEWIEPYLGELSTKITNLVFDARASAQLSCITYAIGRCNLAAHRDYWDENSRQFVCGFNPSGEADDTVIVGRITNDTDEVTAVLVNYACHPTTLAWQNTLISPDFPGAMREVVENVTNAPCVFLQGASGDLGPREGFVGDVAVAEKNGRQLGYAVMSALESLPPPKTKYVYRGPVLSGATIGEWEHRPLSGEETDRAEIWKTQLWTVDLPYRSDLPTVEEIKRELSEWQAEEQQATDDSAKRDHRAMVERKQRQLTRVGSLPSGDAFPFPVSIWRMGDALWVFVEGELYQWFQQSLRREFPDNPIIVVTLTNGSRISYLPVNDAYGKGIYQETVAYLAAGSLEMLQRAVCEQVAETLR